MPQIDIIIIVSQLQFLLFFFLNYFFFLKKVLPLISIKIKVKQKLLLSHINWFSNNINKLIFYRDSYYSLLVKYRSILNFTNLFTCKHNIFYGIYNIDLLLIRSKYLNKK
jgi:hypothetical protein